MVRMRACPKCKSLDVHPDLSLSSIALGEIFNKYLCSNCGYNSVFFPEIDVNIKKKKP